MTGTSDVEALARALATGLVAVDFDGTLAPIVRDPTAARPAAGAADALRRLAARGTQVAVITGREAEVVVELSGLADLPGLIVDGVYGAQQIRAGVLTRTPTPDSMRAARAEIDDVLAAAGADPAVWVEDKDVSFVVHARQADDPDTAMATIEPPVADLAARHGLELHPGKQVLELRVPGIDKGVALGTLLDELDPAGLLWAGDDLGDIPAFERLRTWRAGTGRPALGVAVRATPSADPLAGRPDDELAPELARLADLVVDGPEGFVALLERLAAG